jgi:hypothetical protein
MSLGSMRDLGIANNGMIMVPGGMKSLGSMRGLGIANNAG